MPNRTYLGIWDCIVCNTTGLTSKQIHCPNCGSSIPLKKNGYPDTRQPAPEDISKYEVKDAEMLKKIQEGIGVWKCRWCGSVHSEEDQFCDSCGASQKGEQFKGLSKTNNAVVDKVDDKPQQLEEVLSPNIQNEYKSDDLPSKSVQSASASTRSFVSSPTKTNIPWQKIGIAIFALCISLGMFWGIREFVIKEKLSASVQSHSWERVQLVEVNRWTAEKNQSSCPANSRNCKSLIEQIGTRRVKVGSHNVADYSSRTVNDGESCDTVANRDGSFTERCSSKSHQESYQSGSHSVDDYADEAVFGTVYHYEIQEWVFSRKLIVSGNDWYPLWPSDYKLGTPQGEPERLGSKTESYNIIFVASNENTYPWQSNNEVDWKAFEKGDVKFIVIVNGNGRLVSAGIDNPDKR